MRLADLEAEEVDGGQGGVERLEVDLLWCRTFIDFCLMGWMAFVLRQLVVCFPLKAKQDTNMYVYLYHIQECFEEMLWGYWIYMRSSVVMMCSLNYLRPCRVYRIRRCLSGIEHFHLNRSTYQVLRIKSFQELIQAHTFVLIIQSCSSRNLRWDTLSARGELQSLAQL